MALLSGPLSPAWLVGRVYERLLREIPVDDAWVRTVEQAAARGAVVYLVRNVSLLDLLALDHLTRRFGLPRIGFANELGAWLGPELLRGAAPERLCATVRAGGSALLFMKRPPTVLSRVGAAHRGRNEGSELVRVLVEQQRAMGGEIMLVPQTLLWTQRPERLGFSLVDTVFGSADFPGELRAAGQLLFNYKNSVVRAGEPVSVREFLAAEGSDDAVASRRLTYAMLRKVERERRAVLGPVQKPSDRIREEVLRSPKLQATLRDLAGPDEKARALLEDKARGMLRELMTMPDPGLLRGLETIAETLAEQVYAGIDVDKAGFEQVREAAKRGSVVLLPSHKSHVDYLLLSLVMRKNGLAVPVIAAGDNLSFFPVGPVFRRAGAFFIRRSFRGDRLYTAVVDAYVRRLMRDGFAIEFFLEGGRSRTGKLLPPKLGLLNMVVDAGLSLEGRTISFVPVSIGYERMMEEGAYARELSGAAKRKEDAAALLKVGAVLREKYGRANVQFGQVIELTEMRRMVAGEVAISPPKRRALVSRLAHRVMSEINRVTAVTPGSLVATALLCHGRRGLPHAELIDHCRRLVKLVHRLGARTTPSLTRTYAATADVPAGASDMRESAIREAAQLYVRGGLVVQHVPGDTLTRTAKKRAKIYTGEDVIYAVPDNARLMLDISKNIIVHLFVDRALVSVALLAPPGPPAPRAAVRERVQSLSRLFKLEFMFRADASFDENFADTVGDMLAQGELAAGEGDTLTFGPGHDGLDGRGWITFYAAVVRSFLESYRISARALRVLVRAPMTEKELSQRALRIGEQMFLGGEIERSEAVCQPTLENAFAAFVDQGYVKRADGKLQLAESFASEETAGTIETRVSSYLLRRAGEGSW
ncbi:MAG: 1-acyl-sn-glycerol-3-phosphate acyltransferase [Minicystis sp.]